MSEPRTKLTLTWRPTGAPARRHDDFIEIGGASATTRTLTPAPLEVAPARRAGDIGRRLENWGMWANEQGSRGPDCMTGAICERARRAAEGDLLAGANENERINVADAECINAALPRVDERHLGVLQWTYVVGLRPSGVAGACGFPRREYDARLTDAQGAVESVAGKYREKIG